MAPRTNRQMAPFPFTRSSATRSLQPTLAKYQTRVALVGVNVGRRYDPPHCRPASRRVLARSGKPQSCHFFGVEVVGREGLVRSSLCPWETSTEVGLRVATGCRQAGVLSEAAARNVGRLPQATKRLDRRLARPAGRPSTSNPRARRASPSRDSQRESAPARRPRRCIAPSMWRCCVPVGSRSPTPAANFAGTSGTGSRLGARHWTRGRPHSLRLRPPSRECR
jgi:hypothetical protein